MNPFCRYLVVEKRPAEPSGTRLVMVPCARYTVVEVVNPLDGSRYPLCKRHWGKRAQAKVKRENYLVEHVSVEPVTDDA